MIGRFQRPQYVFGGAATLKGMIVVGDSRLRGNPFERCFLILGVGDAGASARGTGRGTGVARFRLCCTGVARFRLCTGFARFRLLRDFARRLCVLLCLALAASWASSTGTTAPSSLAVSPLPRDMRRESACALHTAREPLRPPRLLRLRGGRREDHLPRSFKRALERFRV